MSIEDTERSLRDFLQRSGADWRVAECPAESVERLRQMDHHVVTHDGRAALLLTYHLWIDPLPPRARVYLLFQHVAGHPRAPADVQMVVDALTFGRT